MKTTVYTGVALFALSTAAFGQCPGVTIADPSGVPTGAYPQQFELQEFETNANCTLSFAENPQISSLNDRIRGNTSLPALADRLPSEPLVVAPYDDFGIYGGTLDVLSNATEAGTADFLSVRHVNLVRYSDDLATIVPNVAKGWSWNDDFTQLTFYLRNGHKWSDGAPFTAEDVKFWYDNISLDTKIYERPNEYVLVGGKPMTVDVVDPQTVRFNLPAPKPGFLVHFATTYAQAFLPKHFLGQYHPDINPDADKLAQEAGFETGLDVITAYYGNSDWTDKPSPLLNSPDKVAKLPADVMPSLESHIIVAETDAGRHLVANPYFHMVDTQGNQLPYISEQDEVYINDNEIRIQKLLEGAVDYKAQSLQLPSAPLLLEIQNEGNYTVDLRPAVSMPVVSFNVTHPDLEKRKIFADLRFRKAMSIAINREEINEVAFFGLGEKQQYIGFTPAPTFVDAKWLKYAAEFNPEAAKLALAEVGLKDVNGNGFLDLPNGDPLVIKMQYTTQGIAGQVVKIVGQHWKNVGIQTTVEEIAPDDYRAWQTENKLDVALWEKGQPLAIILGNNELWVPPFENYFAHRSGMLWAEWVATNGQSGVEPPAYVMQLIDDIHRFQSLPIGAEESKEIGSRMVQTMTENLLFIGTVNAPLPIYHKNTLKNFPEFKTASYEYFRTYPYRAQQWYLEE